MRNGWIVVVLLAATGCANNPRAGADAGGDGGPLTGDATRGMMFVTASSCSAATICHGADLGGQTSPSPTTMVYPRNITPDGVTGIGSYSDQEIATAVRTGVTRGGRTLCPQMLRFPSTTDQQMADLIAYLRSVAPVSRAIPTSSCP